MKTRPLPLCSFALFAFLFAGAMRACASGPAFEARPPVDSPEEARFVTEDIARFWAAYDEGAHKPGTALEESLQRRYLDRGTPGVVGFTPHRIESAENLARVVRARHADYEAARERSMRVGEQGPAIRAALREFERMYPDAVFPDVYFVIGAMNSGGTSTPSGLIIGMEMDVNRPEKIAALVAHEAVHYQQAYSGARRLLEQCMIEGSADFVALLVTRDNINAEALAYAREHERELWEEFRPMLESEQYGTWLYVRDPDRLDGRPPDLGYAMGCLIAEAYYEQASDKEGALRDIVRCENPRAIFEKSGYAMKFE